MDGLNGIVISLTEGDLNLFKEDEIDEDKRQVDRWIKFTGPKGRFKLNLINKIKAKDASYDDYSVSPIIRQSLLRWGYELTENDFK